MRKQTSRTRKQTSLILAAGLALLVVMGTVACNSKAQSSDADAAEAPSALVVRVNRANIVRKLNVAGQFQPYQVVEVHAKVSGYIRHIYVDIGDKVHQGEILAVLEVPELNAQLKGTVSQMAFTNDEITRSRHEVLRAESEHTALHQDYIRLKQAAAAQPGLIAQQELDDAQSKDLAAEAEIDVAKAALAAAKQQSAVAGANNERVGDLANYTKVTAPLDGVITWRYADTGDLVQAGTTSDVQSRAIVQLAQSGLLRLRLPVPEDAVRFIHPGAPVQVNVGALNRTFTGKVVRFTRNVSLATRTMETEVDVENKDLSIIPGMYANTTLDLESRNNVLTIPVSAVIESGAQPSVLVLNRENRVESRPVALGLQNSMLVEIKSGLKEGEFVIASAQSNYQAGEMVKPKLQRPQTMGAGEQQSGDEQ